MPPALPHRRRARPVADAPIDVLLPRTADLAKGWLLALLEDARLESAPALLSAPLIVEGPQLCEAVLRALVGEEALGRLEPGGALGALSARAGELAGAGPEPAATVRAVDALEGVVWAALRRELTGADAELVSDLAERVARVCALLRVAALERLAGGGVSGGGSPAGADATAARPDGGTPAERASSPERLWVEALREAILRADNAPLSLLLVELEDAERVATTESAVAATAAFEHFARAVRGAVRRRDTLVSESAGRAWIIARDTGRTEAHALAARVAQAVGFGAGWRGAPLIASVGVAVLGDDGRGADELIDAAEEARFAAAASGTDVAD